MKRMILATAALALVAGSAVAQEVKDGQWRGVAGMSASLSAGNTTSRNFVANASVARSTAVDKLSFYGNALSGYTEVAGVKTSNQQWLVGTKYDHDIAGNLYGFGQLNFEGDKARNLSLRSSLGAGLGYHVVASKENTFNIFGGVAYTHDKFRAPQVINGETRSTYGAPELMLGEESSHKLTDTVSFQQKAIFYPNLKDTKEYRATFDAGLAVAMNKTLNLTVGVADRYNSMVPAGVKKNDLTVYTGVSMKLGAQ